MYSLVFLTVAPYREALLSWKVLPIEKTPSGHRDSRELRNVKELLRIVVEDGCERIEGSRGMRARNDSEQ